MNTLQMEVSFSITDASVNNAVEVNMTYESYQSLIFLRSGQEDIIVPLVNDKGENLESDFFENLD
ncbi:hypothetical protein MEG05_08200 [Vibrio aestuarianus]|uniref:hypothetical protein n=1 Tax=Vibrio aestuarianus TaxID=28171 RepID=UPI00237C6AFA|nr:hypothetical protein [Vibrio aestuarianus]MDE1314184.1 hypothetical protein [Vibrio aestuarianus]